ncbi:hypothetical protein [Microbacterium sp. 1P06AB]|uniref:hypothetical protein n=1 Tax=Microbacterium sp. 1P06AB TaxID=3132289 RepID=UPI0039A42D44
MTTSREQLSHRLEQLRSQRQDAIVSGLALPGIGGGGFNERVHDLNDEIASLEREIEALPRE